MKLGIRSIQLLAAVVIVAGSIAFFAWATGAFVLQSELNRLNSERGHSATTDDDGLSPQNWQRTESLLERNSGPLPKR